MLSFLFAVFLSQPRDASKKGKQVDLHFDLSFCVPTLITKNVNVKGKGWAPFSSPQPVVARLGNEGLWKQPLPDVRKFLTSGRACAKVTNITAHAHNGFLSLTAPLGEKFYFLSSLQRVASLGCFENAPLHSTWIH